MPRAWRSDGDDQRSDFVAILSEYRLVRPFFRRVLDHVDRFCMQSDESARRLVDLGADAARISVTGSLKFDSLDSPPVAARQAARTRAALLPDDAESHGDRRRQHDARRRDRGAAGVRAHQNDARRARCDSRATPAQRFGEVERLARDEGFVTVRAKRVADRRRASG